jgi:hypothetical protein
MYLPSSAAAQEGDNDDDGADRDEGDADPANGYKKAVINRWSFLKKFLRP